LAPQFAPVCCVEISTHVAEENDATRRRRHAALNGIICFGSPSPNARISFDGVSPTRPIKSGVRLTPRVERVDRCFAGPRFAGLHGGNFLGRHNRNGGAPFDLADENEVQLGIVSGTVPLGAAGYDVESRDPRVGRLRFIEVKGRHADGRDVIVTENEIIASLNTPEAFVLAIVQVDGGFAREPVYVRRFFKRELGFAETAVVFNVNDLLSLGAGPF
jgi:hypothetical protein